MSSLGVAVRVLVLVLASWLLAGLAIPTPDPFVVTLVWLVVVASVLAIPTSRRGVLRWIGRRGRASAAGGRTAPR